MTSRRSGFTSRTAWRIVAAPCVAAVAAGMSGGIARVSASTVAEIAVPSLDSAPIGIAAGPSTTLWFVENTGGAVGRIDQQGNITEFAVPDNSKGIGGSLNSITEGPDGAMWFTDESPIVPRIGRIDPSSGTVTMFELPTTGTPSFAGTQPLAITAGHDGALWFTTYGGLIGRIDTAGQASAYRVTNTGQTRGITVAPDGGIWFTTDSTDGVGRLDPSTGTSSFYHLRSTLGSPRAAGITVGPDGALWFAESGIAAIGRLDPTTGKTTTIALPTAGSVPFGITSGPDGGIWFTEAGAGNVGRVDPVTRTVAEYPLSSGLDAPMQVAAGADGRLWTTEAGVDRIGVLDPTQLPTGAANAAPAPGVIPAAFESHCPSQVLCVTQVTTGGTFRVKSFTQDLPPGAIRLTGYLPGPINPDGTLTLHAPIGAKELLSQRVPVPGGLLGTFPLLGPIVGPLVGPANALSISLTLAGPVEITPSPLSASVPVTLHLHNPLLGSSCTIGPIDQHLVTAFLSSKANDPSMSWQPERIDATDNTFSVPGAQGCGALPLVFDPIINTQLGLPSPSGSNAADLPGVFSLGGGVHT